MAGGTLNFTYPITEKSIGGVEIDAFFLESYNFSNRLTNLTVEEGSNISDHVIEEPDTIDIEAFIGNTKFETNESPISDVSDVEVLDDPKSRIRENYHKLLRLKRERQPLDVVTGLDTFTDMVIVSFNIDRDAETGADLNFTMRFQKIKTVMSDEVEISVSPVAAAADQASPIVNLGPAGKNNLDDDNSMKERWRQLYYTTGGKAPTREEFFEVWGSYPEKNPARL